MDNENLTCSRLPLTAYSHLTELEKAYETDFSSGIHLYENGGIDWREYLPSPIPASFHIPGHHIPRIKERNKKLTEELNQAREEGIVYRDMLGYRIKRTRIGYMASLPAANMTNFLKEVRTHMFDDDKVDMITMQTYDARHGFEDTVFVDNYLRSPKIQQIVREQLAIVRELDQKIAKLETKEAFFNGVFTGVIKLQRAKITFSYDQSGEEQTLELQNNSMPYGKKAPLYQAYLTYLDLDRDMRHKIQEETSDAIDNMTGEIYDVSKKVHDRYSPEYIKFLLSKTMTDRNRKEIAMFYNDFLRTLTHYITIYSAAEK